MASEQPERPGQGLAERMRDGLRAGEFCVVFQPVTHVATGEVSSVECLLRWQHPTYGLLLPGAFLHAFDQDPQVAREASYFVFESVCGQMQGLQRAGLRVPRIAVNILPSQLLDDELHDRLFEITARHEIDPSVFELELVETQDAATLLCQPYFTRALRSLGVAFALDDFGTGYSSLAALATLQVDRIKLARELFSEVPACERACRIVSAMLTLSAELGIAVTVEGVETEAQWGWLLQFPDVHMQGYYLAKPKQTLAQALFVGY
jgi:EAL domain-containing protein (putative c-di-GMP-specific phosphodiesterase class I)